MTRIATYTVITIALLLAAAWIASRYYAGVTEDLERRLAAQEVRTEQAEEKATTARSWAEENLQIAAEATQRRQKAEAERKDARQESNARIADLEAEIVDLKVNSERDREEIAGQSNESLAEETGLELEFEKFIADREAAEAIAASMREAVSLRFQLRSQEEITEEVRGRLADCEEAIEQYRKEVLAQGASMESLRGALEAERSLRISVEGERDILAEQVRALKRANWFQKSQTWIVIGAVAAGAVLILR